MPIERANEQKLCNISRVYLPQLRRAFAPIRLRNDFAEDVKVCSNYPLISYNLWLVTQKIFGVYIQYPVFADFLGECRVVVVV